MQAKYLAGKNSLLAAPNVNQPDNALVWHSADNRQLPEILVQRDKNLTRPVCASQNLLVAWVT